MAKITGSIGKKVTDRNQALAIAFSSQRRADDKKSKKRRGSHYRTE